MGRLQIWIQAFRLRTLPLAIAGILTGASLASGMCNIQWPLFFLLIITAVLLQVLSNLANDYGDFKKGTDQGHRTDRMMASGLIQEGTMFKALLITALMALICGLVALKMAFPQTGYGFWMFLLLGMGAIVAAVNYTVGKRPYGYHGLGDVFVFIFFGIVAVLGSAYLLSGGILMPWVFPASTVGSLSVAVLHINNVRDLNTDSLVGKRTVAVILGRKKAFIYQWMLYVVSLIFLVVFCFMANDFLVLLSGIVPIFQMTMWYRTSSNANAGKDDYNKMLKVQALGTFFFSLFFSVLSLL